jgi:hypothetical protein
VFWHPSKTANVATTYSFDKFKAVAEQVQLETLKLLALCSLLTRNSNSKRSFEWKNSPQPRRNAKSVSWLLMQFHSQISYEGRS